MNNTKHTSAVHLKPLQKTRSNTPVVLGNLSRQYPAQATVRVFVPLKHEDLTTVLFPRQKFIARALSFMLIPAILLNFAGRAYADEITAVGDGTPSTSEVLPQEVTDVPLQDTSVVETPKEFTEAISTPESVSEETPTPALESGEVSLPAPEELGGETEIITSTDNTSPEETTEVAGGVDSGGGGGAANEEMYSNIDGVSTAENEAIVTSASTSPEETTSENILEEVLSLEASSTNVLPSDESTSTDEETQVTDEVSEDIAPVANVESAADVANALALREERYRQELRKQVEDEFLRGCISFEASGYYCLNTNNRTSEVAAPQKDVVTIEAAQGEGGDKEIFIVKNGKQIALTTNNWDDAFPAQNISGDQYVWQGMVNGRWQIFTGNLSGTGTPVVTQVTDSRDSNFNPKIDGDHIVWQGWADDNWEIFLATKRDDASPFAGEHLPSGNLLLNVGPAWKVERLTTNKEPDMFPSLHGDIVTWQAHEGDNWIVYAYSIEALTMTKLSSDGVKSENPRFMLTWEEHDEEGHARLMSYDMSTGKKSDLTTEAKNVSGDPFREKLPSPISQPNQATLPVGNGTGTSTPVRGDDDAGGSNDLLP